MPQDKFGWSARLVGRDHETTPFGAKCHEALRHALSEVRTPAAGGRIVTVEGRPGLSVQVRIQHRLRIPAEHQMKQPV